MNAWVGEHEHRFATAVRGNDVKALKTVLQDHPGLLEQPLGWALGRSTTHAPALLAMLSIGAWGSAQTLLALGADPCRADPGTGRLPLYQAVLSLNRCPSANGSRDAVKTVESLLAHGADPHALGQGPGTPTAFCEALAGDGDLARTHPYNRSVAATGAANAMWRHSQDRPWPAEAAWWAWMKTLLFRNDSWIERLTQAQADPGPADPFAHNTGLVAMVLEQAQGHPALQTRALRALAPMGLRWHGTDPRQSALRHAYETLQRTHTASHLSAVWGPGAAPKQGRL